MTEKEFRKLNRREVLQLLLTQVQEEKELRLQLDKTEKKLQEMEDGYERLKARLNSKDAKIHKLAGRLDKKDVQIKALKSELERHRTDRRIRLREAGSIAEAALKLNGVFEAAQAAANQYLENIERMYGGRKKAGSEKEGGEEQPSERSDTWE
jgi:chromosome segregation ATPase